VTTQLNRDCVKQKACYIFGGRLEFIEGGNLVEISVVQLFEHAGGGFLEVSEIDHHSAAAWTVSPRSDIDSVIMAVKSLAFSVIVSQPMSGGEPGSDFNLVHVNGSTIEAVGC
jgi:hypothetical protein